MSHYDVGGEANETMFHFGERERERERERWKRESSSLTSHRIMSKNPKTTGESPLLTPLFFSSFHSSQPPLPPSSSICCLLLHRDLSWGNDGVGGDNNSDGYLVLAMMVAAVAIATRW
ncbi:hypothetical protein U1Q18_052550 [Sarracenia purpurea var. burkii]